MRDVDTAIQSRNIEGIKAAIQAGANLEARDDTDTDTV